MRSPSDAAMEAAGIADVRPMTPLRPVGQAVVVVTIAVVAVALLGGPAHGALAAGAGAVERRPAGGHEPWAVVLRDVVEASQRTPYLAELQVLAYGDDAGAGDRVQTFQVRNDGRGTVTLRAPDRYTMRLAEAGGSLAHHAEGWFAPLPVTTSAVPAPDLDELAGKYAVELTGGQRALGRPATRVDIRRRGDGRLCERLWVDSRTGLVVRRDTFDGESRPLVSASFLSLDVGPLPESMTARDRASAPRASRAGLAGREQGARTVPVWRLETLAEAGWTVPKALPAGYDVSGSYAVDAGGSQPLHLVYDDGLYTVSLFEQRGHPDWGSLPRGAVRSDLIDGTAYEWPGAVPRRLVWEADGTTYTLVGDAPPGEFATIARALPQPREPGMVRRLGQGLRRLLAWVSPW